MNRFIQRALCSILLCMLAASSLAEEKIDDATLKNYLEASDYWNVRLSPDGQHVSVMTRRDDRNTLVVLDLETMKPTASVRYERHRWPQEILFLSHNFLQQYQWFAGPYETW